MCSESLDFTAQMAIFFHTGHALNEFVVQACIPYIEDDHPEVRRAAALTTCRLFGRDTIVYQTSMHSIDIISDVLGKLLMIGIADPGE